MFKGLSLALAIILFGFCFYSLYSAKTPVFFGYANEYEVYLSAGSFGDHITATDETFTLYKNIKGESCLTGVPYERVLKSFNATHLFSEQAEGGVIYYAYSPKIKYRANIRGAVVNLQYYAGESFNKIGTPLIYGSF